MKCMKSIICSPAGRLALSGLILVICILFPGAPCPCEASAYTILDDRLWKLRYVIYIENPSTCAGDAVISFPLVPSDMPSQEVLARDFPALPLQKETDDYGNTRGIWKVKILPRQMRVISCSYTIKTSHVRWDGPVLPSSLPASGDSERYLREEPLIECTQQSVREAAMRLCGEERYPYYRALRMYDYLLSHYLFDPHEAIYGAQKALGKRIIQCSDAAVLYIALLRASGIPSRFTGGIFVTPDTTVYKEFHSWAEVLLPGHTWAMVDPTLGRFDSTHRLQCFMERRSDYITLWRGTPNPFRIECSEKEGAKLRTSFYVSVTRLSERKKTASLSGSDEIQTGYESFPRKPKNRWKSTYTRSAAALYARGAACEKESRDAEAAAEYFAALQASPAYWAPVKALLRMYREGRCRDLVMKGFRKIVERSPEEPLFLYARGELERLCQNYSASRDCLNSAGKLGFHSSELYFSEMLLFASTKERRPFEEALVSYMSCGSPTIEAYRKAIFFYEDLEMWDYCLYWASKGGKAIPASGFFPAMKGYACLQSGKLAKARTYIREAIGKDPSMGWYYCILGWTLLKEGDRAGARQAIEKGLSLGKGVDNPNFYRDLLKTPGK